MKDAPLLIRADGSKEIGMGHVVQMIALAKELKKQGIKPIFVTYKDPETINRLKRNGLLVKEISNPCAYREISAAVKEICPKIIIDNTWKNESYAHFKALKVNGSRLIGIVQTGLGLQKCDIVINPLPQSFVKNHDKIKAKYYSGLKYLIFDSKAQELASKIKFFSGPIKNIVMTIGGRDTHELGGQIKDHMQKLLPHTNIQLIKGDLNQWELFKLIHKADLAITGGGNTIFEAAFFGTPTIGIAQETWEKINTKYASNYNASINAGFRSGAYKNLSTALSLLTPQKRRQMSLAGQKLIDGKGLERTVMIIKNLL